MPKIMYPTPHINAVPGDFAETVLMPGDPLRAKFIAENFLSHARLVNNVRGVQGYTGSFNGSDVSVMASGMGMPSIGIYSYELFNIFGVESIIRVGSAGSLNRNVHVRDIVIAQGACTNSAFANQYHLNGNFAPIADYGLLRSCCDIAENAGIRFCVGNVLSSDTFYKDEIDMPENMTSLKLWGKMGVLATEMEAAALYMTAARYNKKALAILTVSDSLITGESTTADERQCSFTQMIELALNTAVKQSKCNSDTQK